MQQYYSARTRGGIPWIPRFILSIRQKDCTACGKCYQVCAPQVLAFEGVDRAGHRVSDGTVPFRRVMGIQRPDLCRGCEACGMACPLDLFQFREMEMEDWNQREIEGQGENEQKGEPTGQNIGSAPQENTRS